MDISRSQYTGGGLDESIDTYIAVSQFWSLIPTFLQVLIQNALMLETSTNINIDTDIDVPLNVLQFT